MSNTAKDQAIAQVASIVEMVAALDVDYDRLEELREKKNAGFWVAGWNMPGYRPDSEPAAFEDFEDARAYVVDSLSDDMHGLTVDDKPTEACQDAINRVKEMPESEYGETVGDFHYWIVFHGNALSDSDETKELSELEEAAGDCTDADDARQRIEEDALSVEVRSDWCSPGEEMHAGEFRILLCTGGPHVEIVGDLDEHKQPSRPRILYKDWGDCGELFDFDRDAVTRYCSVFYFGE